MGLKEQLLAAKRKIETIHIPELGMDGFMRRMSGAERNVYHVAELKADKAKELEGLAVMLPLRPLLLSLTLCDADGKRIMTPEEVLEMDSAVIEILADKALEINALTIAAREAIEKKFTEANP